MADLFISYASEDRPHAEHLAQQLSAHGYSVWWDSKLQPGIPYSQVIQDRLRAAKAIIVVWTPASAKSQWVYAEAEIARGLNTVIPVFAGGLNPREAPPPFNTLHMVASSDLDSITSSLEARKIPRGAAAPTTAGLAAATAPPRRARRVVATLLAVLTVGGGAYYFMLRRPPLVASSGDIFRVTKDAKIVSDSLLPESGVVRRITIDRCREDCIRNNYCVAFQHSPDEGECALFADSTLLRTSPAPGYTSAVMTEEQKRTRHRQQIVAAAPVMLIWLLALALAGCLLALAGWFVLRRRPGRT